MVMVCDITKNSIKISSPGIMLPINGKFLSLQQFPFSDMKTFVFSNDAKPVIYEYLRRGFN
jgi:hypothetical protein